MKTKSHCFECGVLCDPKPERAHIIAKCDGGPDTVDNLVLVCHWCHVLTDGRTKDEWMYRLINGSGGITFAGLDMFRIPSDFLVKMVKDKNPGPSKKRFLELLVGAEEGSNEA